MTTELAIEREAKLRAQKKKILQLQKLKYVSGYHSTTNGGVAPTEGVNKNYLFVQDRRIKLSGHKALKATRTASECSDDRSLNNSVTSEGQTHGKVSGIESSETRGCTPEITNPVFGRESRHFIQETDWSYKAATKRDGVQIFEAEREGLYTPSFASGYSDYHRKANEIKKKVAERRRNLEFLGNRHSSLFNSSSTDNYRSVDDFRPRGAFNRKELHPQQHGFGFDTSSLYPAKSPTNSRIDNVDILLEDHYTLADQGALCDSFSAPKSYRINFEGFARKQQEILEDSLRRLEENLDSTFSRLRRYIRTVNALSRNQVQT
ncbi:uncharacterized protein [Montipora foliosa]|uniref:uncharacterized protein n=1 Tax=Montipora foliosa TaxID=591990 RepID=UPI0035F20851